MDHFTAEALIDALDARQGIIAVVGAGGKKTTLHRLIEAHRIIGTKRIALTATVKMAPAAKSLNIPMIVGDAKGLLPAVQSTLGSNTCVLIAAPSTTSGRLSGIPQELIQPIHDEGMFNVTFVKADGARMRLIKAPNDDEPILPNGTTTILPIVSARVFGKPISSRIAHRPEKLLTVINDVTDAGLQPRHIARFLASDKGALHQIRCPRIVPVINMVDKPELLDLARETAKVALSMTDRYDRVILASMLAASPLIEVVDRS